MSKSIPFKGTDAIGAILTEFGKIAVGNTRKITLEIEVISTMSLVCVPVIPNKEDKEKALATLTETERAEFARLSTLLDRKAKSYAATRIDGATAERWAIKGTATA